MQCNVICLMRNMPEHRHEGASQAASASHKTRPIIVMVG